MPEGDPLPEDLVWSGYSQGVPATSTPSPRGLLDTTVHVAPGSPGESKAGAAFQPGRGAMAGDVKDPGHTAAKARAHGPGALVGTSTAPQARPSPDWSNPHITRAVYCMSFYPRFV